MSKVLAKFRLVGCSADRVGEYGTDPESGRYTMVASHIASHVKLSAVQGEPFGSATPSGSVDMVIQNPAAARIFQDAWDAYVRSEDPKAMAPEFFLTFKKDTGEGAD